MAINTNKRVATKHIRDGIKSNYNKKTNCEVCDATESLELHHYVTVSILLKKYAKANNIDISTDEAVLAMRDKFYKVYWHELVDDTVTLCATHHKLLHKVYGKEPPMSTAKKQARWVAKQHDKMHNIDSVEVEKPKRRRLSDLI